MNQSKFVPGVIATPPNQLAKSFDYGLADQPVFSSSGKTNWFDEIVPTDPQVDPSCVGRSTAQMLMAIIRRQFGNDAIPKGYKLDGDFLWRQRRMKHYNGNLNGGLQLNEGILEAVDQGWIAGVRYGIAAIPMEYGYIDKMLRVTPLLFGFAITPGWYEPNRSTGQISFRGLPNPNDGHAVIGVDANKHDISEYLVIANSWGLDWGRYGYGTLTMDQVKQQAISDAIGLYLPDGIGEAWRDHLTPE